MKSPNTVSDPSTYVFSCCGPCVFCKFFTKNNNVFFVSFHFLLFFRKFYKIKDFVFSNDYMVPFFVFSVSTEKCKKVSKTLFTPDDM